MDHPPSIEDPYAVFEQLTADPYLSQLSPLPPTPHSARAPSFPPAPQPISQPAAQPDGNFVFHHPNGPNQANGGLNQASQKRYPEFSSTATAHTSLLSTLRRHLVAILRSRIPAANEDIANPILGEAFAGPLTTRVWRIVYELVDLEGVVPKGAMEMEELKRRLVRELVGCVPWYAGMDGWWEAGRLVEDLWPAGEVWVGRQ
ncbi:hypothetical protein P171DRAFT_478701 [Karstenula rhodostoma CBS 690.94]|uniref:Uncharacterized protein n=1 Tax=Karstenula rhodostoma CBS 690.94 TaxID=1392251 RepID=A0A9P4PYR5_9PLEO|nr:hypothetical protein P171DRAFT_478701 [Karstenula rhodostoma CBS 690.94]